MQTENITSFFRVVTIIGLLFIALRAEGQADDKTADQNQLVLLEARLTELETRVDELEAKLDDAELAADSESETGDMTTDERRAAAAAQREKEKKAQTQKLLDDAMAEIVLLDTKIETLPSGSSSPEDKIKYLKAKAKLYAEKERQLKKIKNLAHRNPQLGIDVIKIDGDIISTQAKKDSAYDEIARLKKIERERKKAERAAR